MDKETIVEPIGKFMPTVTVVPLNETFFFLQETSYDFEDMIRLLQ